MEIQVINAIDSECRELRSTNKGRYERDMRFELDSFTYMLGSTLLPIYTIAIQYNCHQPAPFLSSLLN